MENSDIGKELCRRLDEMFGNPDTTFGVYVNAGSDEARLEIIKFLNTAESIGDDVTETDVLLLSLTYI